MIRFRLMMRLDFRFAWTQISTHAWSYFRLYEHSSIESSALFMRSHFRDQYLMLEPSIAHSEFRSADACMF